ncbi:type VI secretion system baseplate subunit TssF [Azospirillum himalayense]|uniref:Type VI secretion system baseplate subunit TssF n=1 Tax=Azospirillum himalayense TaxID=654847 RepID=A0ABW0G9Q7_9PROT
MSDDLIAYYNQELVHLRRSAAEFAKAHPVQAGRLRLTGDAVEDPHVARLMEAFAYLAARVRLKLDDDFPQLTEALLGVLYPHYLAPLPSAAVVRFTSVPDLTEPAVLPAGSALNSEAVEGEVCTFRTCCPVTLWPVALESAVLAGRPIAAPENPRARGAVSVLRLTFRTLMPETPFSSLAPDRLRLFLRGAPERVFPLYDLMAGHVLSVAVAEDASDPAPVILGPEAVRPVGFDPDEAMLPADPRTAPGYRLLTKYFAYPESFQFFDLTGLAERARRARGTTLSVFLYLDKARPDLERAVSVENFALGCTPVINLFPQKAEPIPLTHRQTEYRVVPDARRPRGTEVYGIDRVTAAAPDGRRTAFLPFYGTRHAGAPEGRFWHATRRAAGPANPGSELYVSLVDLGFDPAAPAGHVLSLDLTCLNRDLPGKLPFGGGNPRLTPVQGMAAVDSIDCLTPPSRTLRPSELGQNRWRLISHLSLNHLSLTGEGAAEHLREILALYDLRRTPETAAIIDGIVGLGARPAAARAPQGGLLALCRGVDVALDLDPARYSGTSMLLFAAVLERFLALHAAVNSFTRLTLRAKDHGGVLKQWPARAGERILL